ncbi:MAG TPA: sugar ABC transporter ATP-binding protein [Acidobacteriaceae bacterium]|nr:sugar ABC transporter ATP-binding protein [Acidobacteriaceae bacterium]
MSDAVQHCVVLEARGVSKRYDSTLALDRVDFQVRAGAVNVLIGENGAGKSTLMRLLAGVELPNTGDIWMSGRRLDMRSPRDAAAAGIAIVHQELAVMDNLDIAENIFAGRELVRSSALVDRRAEESRGAAALLALGKPIPMRTLAGTLSLGNRQVIEIARALAGNARVLILDEPTSALSATEATALFHVIASLKARGVGIVYISHRLNELLLLGDYFTVLRDGRVVGDGTRDNVDRTWIVERMSGRRIDANQTRAANTSSGNEIPLLEVRGANVKTESVSGSDDLNLAVRKGEIVGIYGLLGAGRTEFLEGLAGARREMPGEVRVDGARIALHSVSDALKAGIALVPEDRQRDGLVPDLSIRENISLASLSGFSRAGFVRRRDESARVHELAEQLHIAARDLELPVTSLSGGNQQKALLARCLMRDPKILLLDEPTRGVDVGAKAEIYRVLRSLAASGLAILFTTSEIEEAQLLADRILVMTQGAFTAEFSAANATDEVLFAAASPRTTVESAA